MNFKDMANQLLYSNYTDMEYGNDTETIDYRALISVLTDLTNRIESLERQLEFQQSYEAEQND
jgi:hypothetical protein